MKPSEPVRERPASEPPEQRDRDRPTAEERPAHPAEPRERPERPIEHVTERSGGWW